jgi:tetraacyldisaccharide 4'-kinase
VPGIVSRGYGGKAESWPQLVTRTSDPGQVGDEAVMLTCRTAAPVAVGPDRPAAARALVESHGCNVIVSDDGLQHTRLERDVEIVVIDGVRRHGNGHLLPAGPLRELPSRLESVDLVVANGEAREREFSMQMGASIARKLGDPGTSVDLTVLSGRKVRAVCGIGNPDRFFDLLRAHGIDPVTSAYPDHHAFSAQDFDVQPMLPVLMTEKDAVKCRNFGLRDAWVVPVSAQLPPEFVTRLDEILQPLRPNTRPAD